MDSIYRAFEPGRNDPCLCASGLKFKKCCAGRYQAPGNVDAARAALHEQRWADALVLTRAYFTQYVIWHRAHTVPFLASGSRHAREILEVDVSALADLLDWMMECHRQLADLERFEVTLELLAPLIDHPRWRQRIVYQRALTALARSSSDEEARRVLAELEPMAAVTDSEILELYVDLHWEDLGVGQSLALLDRIIQANRSPAVRLQYRSVRGVQLFLVGDRQGASAELEAAIAEYKASNVGPDDYYGAHHLARSCATLAGLSERPELLEEAEDLLRDLLRRNGFTASGLALLLIELGDVLLDQGRSEDAREAYLRSLDHSETAVGRLKVAKALTILGAHDRAREYLARVQYVDLTKAEAFDFNVAAARLALANGDRRQSETIAEQFEKLDVRDPYFREIRLGVSAELRNPKLLMDGEVTGFFARIWKGARRYLLLQPNVFGLGINLNALMDDAAGGSAPAKGGRVPNPKPQGDTPK